MKKTIMLCALFLAFSAQLLQAQRNAPSGNIQVCPLDEECSPDPDPTPTPPPPDPTPTPALQNGVPWISPNAASGVSSAPPGAHLTYFGGPVISNVHVVEVLYGSGSYNLQVAGSSSPTIGNFFSDLLGANSGYISLLTQYNTTVPGGTNQTIGNGTFDGLFQILPSAANNGSIIDDSNIQAELLAQINASHLPAPILDAAGNVNTVYMIYFPPGKTITQNGSSNCGFGSFPFCAYHGTTSQTIGNRHVLYSVHPDLQPGSACFTGCGSSTVFGNYTSVTSHELTEAITDPDVGIATTFAPPLAWYDINPNHGEIGDLCNAQQGSYTANGTTYTIQLEFSNLANNCVLPPNFSLSSSPTSLAINQSGSATSTIQVIPSGGFTGSVTLSAVSALPVGVTVSFSPNPTTSTSVATFTANSTATIGTANVTIRGTSSGVSQEITTIALTVKGPIVSLTPSSLVFLDTTVGSVSTLPITLGNIGSAPLLINTTNGISTSGDFTSTPNCPSSLAPNTSCTFTVTFTPTATGQRLGNLTINDNAQGSPHTVPLSGNGVGVPILAFSPTSLAFGNQTVGTASPVQQVTLSNQGTGPLLISSPIGISGDFTQTPNCPSSLAPNTSCTFTVTFTPTATGQRLGNLTIIDNAQGSPHQVPLSGNGVVPIVVFSPTSLAFGNQTVGTTSPVQQVALSNQGAGILMISSPIGISGDFSQTNNCPSSLAPNTSCVFSVTFAPTTPGQQSKALSITDNAAGSPHQVPLSGSGVPLVSPPSLTFPGQIVQTPSVSQPITITNYTGNPLIFSSGAISTTSSDFLFSTNCTNPLAVNTSCTINVTFEPLATGPRTATLSITDNGPGNPQLVSLTGTGLPLIPVLNTISPSVVTTNSNNFTLVATGTGFAANAVVQVNGSPRPTTFLGSALLNAAIPASDLTGSQPLSITVFNPAPSLATSTPVSLTLTSTPIPLISNLTPPRVIACNPTPSTPTCPSFKVTVNGSFFPANSVVQIDGSSLPTNFISANQLTAIVPAANLTTSRMATITVVSSGGGSVSNQVLLAVFQYGDLNFDNVINVTDLVILANIIAGNVKPLDPAPADLNLDGVIDVQDLVILANFLAGNIHSLPVTSDQTALLFNAGATVTLSPPTFAGQTVGSASDPLPLTLTNGGPTPLSISNIIIPPGDFAVQQTTCGSTLAANASCIINVIFSPTAAGSRTGTLTVQDNSINGPHVAVLSGFGRTPSQ